MKYLLFIFYILFCLSTFSNAIIELKDIKDVLSHIPKNETNVLVAFDLDNTTWTSNNKYVWSDNWFFDRYAKYAQQENQLKKWLKDLYSVRFNLNLKLCEIDTQATITTIQQNRNCWVIGLTKRWMCLVPSTLKIISDFNLSFLAGQNTISKSDLILSKNDYPACFTQGVIFTGQNDKDYVLADFLERTNFIPHHIIFIDDNKQNLEHVAEFAKNKNIPYTGIWYSRYVIPQDPYNSSLADLEFEKMEKNFSCDLFPNSIHTDVQQIYLDELTSFKDL